MSNHYHCTRHRSTDVGGDISTSSWWYPDGSGRILATVILVQTSTGWEDGGCCRLRPLQKMVELTLAWSLDFSRTGQKVKTVCLPARSTLILLSYSSQ